MNELIESIATHKEIAIFVIGLLLIIGAITKGGISLGSFEIPKIETGQAKLLGGLGFALTLLAFFLFINPEPEQANNPPEAMGDFRSMQKGEEITIAVLENDTDKDSTDKLKVSLIESPNIGLATLEGSKIRYSASQAGQVKMTYQVSDGVGGKDTADVKIVVKSPPKLITRKGQLINIFGVPKNGRYKTDLINQKESSSDKLISADRKGEFGLRTQEDNEMCHIFIQEYKAEFHFKDAPYIDTVEYDPLDTTIIVFCNGYDEDERKPDSIIFKKRFKIPLNQLKISTEPHSNNRTLDYGELYLAVKFFGAYSKDNQGVLDFYFTQKTGDKTIYDPVEITSNTSPSGWRTYIKKKLLKGEYNLKIKSKNGKKLVDIDFRII